MWYCVCHCAQSYTCPIVPMWYCVCYSTQNYAWCKSLCGTVCATVHRANPSPLSICSTLCTELGLTYSPRLSVVLCVPLCTELCLTHSPYVVLYVPLCTELHLTHSPRLSVVMCVLSIMNNSTFTNSSIVSLLILFYFILKCVFLSILLHYYNICFSLLHCQLL